MTGPLFEYLATDHDRLEALLERATEVPGRIAREPYEEFRKGLLRHIGIEEKIVLPAIARPQHGVPSGDAERLRLDHGAIAALLVPPPSMTIIRTLRSILASHNPLEEGEAGVYGAVERLAGAEAGAIPEQMMSAPDVPVMPCNDRPEVLEATKRALSRAGYEFIP